MLSSKILFLQALIYHQSSSFSLYRLIFFLTVFLSSVVIKFFSTSMPKESKKKSSFFSSLSRMVHQCLPSLLESSGFTIIKGYFIVFFLNHLFKINKFCHFVSWNTPTKLLVKSSSSICFIVSAI